MEQKVAKEYKKFLKKAKYPKEETLTKKQHNLLVKGYKSIKMQGIYDDLGDIERADLSDFFNLERRDGVKF